jgi:photosystem II stability/assembly factor-like uncharacterized protein
VSWIRTDDSPGTTVIAFVAVLFMLFPASSSAGDQRWTTNGPWGGWVSCLAIDARTPTTLYAGTRGGGVFKSSNSGQNWKAINSGLTSTDIVALAIDPSAPATLYAGTSSGSGLDGGIFKTTNGGESWTGSYTFIQSFGGGTNILALAIDPSAPATIYAATSDDGILKSTDGGASWGGLPYGIRGDVLAISPTTPSTLYVGMRGGCGALCVGGLCGGVFKSRDGGQSWEAINSGLSCSDTVSNNRDVSVMAIDPSSPATLYIAGTDGGVFKSTNEGLTWTAVNAGLNGTRVVALAIVPLSSSMLFAGTLDNGVFRSSNGGQSWESVNSGLSSTDVYCLAIDPSSPAILYAGTQSGGVFKSTSSGGSWTASTTGLSSLGILALAIDPSSPATIYAGAVSQTFAPPSELARGGVFKSSDGGGSWAAINTGLANTAVQALAIDPSVPATLYAGTFSGSGFNGGIFKTTNGSQSWTASLTNTDVYALAIHPSAPATIYASTSTGLQKSTDGGGSWKVIGDGGYWLTIDPSDPATIYTSGSDVSRTTDGGVTWTTLLGYPFRMGPIAIDPSAPKTVYVGFLFSPGVMKTTDGGQSWTHADSGIPKLLFCPTYALAIDPSAPATLYAGTCAGLFKSTDGGESWTAFNSGLTNLSVFALAVDSSTPGKLYAGTSGGIFDYEGPPARLKILPTSGQRRPRQVTPRR